MSKSTNTKRTIAESLKKLTETMPLNKITIQNIVDNCSLNRQTFYYHFRDIYDLIEWIFTIEALSEDEGLELTQMHFPTWQKGFLHIAAYIEKNKAFCLKTYHSQAKDPLIGFIYSAVYDLLFDAIGELAKDKKVARENKEMIAAFYTHAFMSFINSWMRSGLKEPPESLVDRLSQLMEGTLEGSVAKYERTSMGIIDETANLAQKFSDFMGETIVLAKNSARKFYNKADK